MKKLYSCLVVSHGSALNLRLRAYLSENSHSLQVRVLARIRGDEPYKGCEHNYTVLLAISCH